MRAELAARNLPNPPTVDSAGTSGFHEGEPADPRMIEAAAQRGVRITSRSRPVAPEDFDRFDRIFAMDGENLRNLQRMAPSKQARERVQAFCDYVDPGRAPADGVPDPYYGGADGFESVLDLLENGCRRIADSLEPGRPLDE